MQQNMTNSRHPCPQNHQQSGTPLSTLHTSSTSATSGEPVTPLDQYSFLQNQPAFDSQFDFSPFDESCNSEGEFRGLDNNYFMREFVAQEPLTSKRNSDGAQNGQNASGNQYQQQYQSPANGHWSVSPTSTTSPPAPRKLHEYSSRRSSTQTNSNLSYTSSSTSASQLNRFPESTPLTTTGEFGSYQRSIQDFPFYSNAVNSRDMSSTQSPLNSLPEDPQWQDEDRNTDFCQDMTPAQNFADAITKRVRAEGRADTISACYTSPLCPQNTNLLDGTPPDPATCGGGCAPFLFGEEPLPDGVNDAALDLPVLSVDQVTMVSRPHSQQQQRQRQDQPQDQQLNKPRVQRVPKRADPDTKHEEQGRNLSKATNSKVKQSSSPEANIVDSIETTKRAPRQPHNKVEQKYRDSINSQMEALRKVIPALSESARACIDDADIEDLPIPSKPSKAVILASATAYIKVQTKEKRQLQTENDALRQRMQDLLLLVGNQCDDCVIMQRAGGMNLRGGPNTDQWGLSFQ